MAASTRPLTLGEILDRTVQLYRRSFLLFAGISFLPSALYVLVAGGASIYFSSQVQFVPQATPPNLQAMLALGLFVYIPDTLPSRPPQPYRTQNVPKPCLPFYNRRL